MLLLDQAHLHQSGLITRLESWVSLYQALQLQDKRAQFDRTLVHITEFALERGILRKVMVSTARSAQTRTLLARIKEARKHVVVGSAIVMLLLLAGNAVYSLHLITS